MKKAVVVILSALMLCSCAAFESDINEQGTGQDTVVIHTDSAPATTTAEAMTTTDTDEPEITEPIVTTLPSYPETEIGEVVYEQEDCYKLYEAENGSLSGYAAAASSREGFSGDGYVSGLSLPDSSLQIELEIDSPQHYSVTVCAASDAPVSCELFVDGLARGTLEISGSGEFEAVKFDNIYLTPGEAIVSFEGLTGECDIDFVLLENSDEAYRLEYSITGELCTPEPSENAARLYRYLCEIYGSSVLSGQQCSVGTNLELDAVANVTGKYPAIRFGELMGYASGVDTGDIELSIEYYKNGGLVGYVWNWMQNSSCYLEKSGFDLSLAMTQENVSGIDSDEIESMLESGQITSECASLLTGIDRIAQQLSKLDGSGIPVLFRPLPQAGNTDFWWNCDKESYQWLYKLIFERLTEYHGLGNLIWVWSAYDPEWYVGDEYCDIISLDVYDFSHKPWDNQSRVNQLIRLNDISEEKPFAISECNVLPAPANIVRDNAYWLYASVWSGNYACDNSGNISTEYISTQEWIIFYNCSAVITREKLTESSSN